MWYEIDHPATWAGLNSFLFGVLSLLSGTLSAMMTQPVLVIFFAGGLMVVAIYLFRELARAAKK